MPTIMTTDTPNAWDNHLVKDGFVSRAVLIRASSHFVAFGSVSAKTTFTVQYSLDGEDWYDSGDEVQADGTFYRPFFALASYARLKSRGTAKVTATLLPVHP